MKVLGVTDSVVTCDCCGKSPLRRTVELQHDDGDIVHYGTTCAALAARAGERNVKKAVIDSACRVFELKRKCSSFKEFVQLTKRLGYAYKIKSPLDSVNPTDCVTWIWGDLHITHKDFA